MWIERRYDGIQPRGAPLGGAWALVAAGNFLGGFHWSPLNVISPNHARPCLRSISSSEQVLFLFIRTHSRNLSGQVLQCFPLQRIVVHIAMGPLPLPLAPRIVFKQSPYVPAPQVLPTQDEWESFHPELQRLYVRERRKLRYVMLYMERKYGFKAR